MKQLIILLLFLITSCGTYKVTELEKLNENTYVTLQNDTLRANRLLTRVIKPNTKYGIRYKDGKLIDARFIKNKH